MCGDDFWNTAAHLPTADAGLPKANARHPWSSALLLGNLLFSEYVFLTHPCPGTHSQSQAQTISHRTIQTTEMDHRITTTYEWDF